MVDARLLVPFMYVALAFTIAAYAATLVMHALALAEREEAAQRHYESFSRFAIILRRTFQDLAETARSASEAFSSACAAAVIGVMRQRYAVAWECLSCHVVGGLPGYGQFPSGSRMSDLADSYAIADDVCHAHASANGEHLCAGIPLVYVGGKRA